MVVEIAGTDGAHPRDVVGRRCASAAPSFDAAGRPGGMARAGNASTLGNSGEVFELEEEIRLTTEAFAAGRTLVGAREAAASPIIVCLEAERSVREGREVPLKLLTESEGAPRAIMGDKRCRANGSSRRSAP